MDEEHDGAAVARALRSPQAADVRRALIDRAFYVDDPEASFRIVGAPEGEAILLLAREGRIKRTRYGALANGYVLDAQGGLGPAIAATRSDHDVALGRAERIIGRAGVRPAMIGRDHWLALAAMFEDAAHGVLPSPAVRAQRYRLIRLYHLTRQGTAILKQWMSLIPGRDVEAAGQIAIGLAWCLRQAGQVSAALAATELVVTQGGRLSPSTLAVLACERAAILLDLYERDRDPTRLVEARRWVDRSFRHDQSDHARAVYNRLSALAGRG